MKSSIYRNLASFGFAVVILAAVLISCGSSPSPRSTPSSQPAPRQQDTYETRQNVYMAILREEGYAPRIDDDGDIELSWQDNTYYLMISQTDPSFVYLRLQLGYIDTNDVPLGIAIAIGNANRSVKVAKAYLVGTNTGREYIYIGSELFLEDPNSMRVIFPRMLNSVGAVAENIVRQLNE
jgi:hypothetical protein